VKIFGLWWQFDCKLLTNIDEIVKISAHYTEFAMGAALVLQSLFVWSLHFETGFIYFKDGVPIN
jgi:hypothetical protein